MFDEDSAAKLLEIKVYLEIAVPFSLILYHEQHSLIVLSNKGPFVRSYQILFKVDCKLYSSHMRSQQNVCVICKQNRQIPKMHTLSCSKTVKESRSFLEPELWAQVSQTLNLCFDTSSTGLRSYQFISIKDIYPTYL